MSVGECMRPLAKARDDAINPLRFPASRPASRQYARGLILKRALGNVAAVDLLGGVRVWKQGLTLVHFPAQPEPFLTQNVPEYPNPPPIPPITPQSPSK